MLKSPGAIAFHIGPLTVYWYGIIIALAFLVGLFITLAIAKADYGQKLKGEGAEPPPETPFNSQVKDYPEDKTREHIIDLSTLLLIGGIVFARLYYVIFNRNYYINHPLEIFMTWKGGLSIHGAIIGSILIIYFYTKRHKIALLKYTDLFAYGMIFAQAVGRWGNFFNSEAFGSPTDLPWKLYIPPANRPLKYMNFEYFHPAFLYESLWDIFVFIILITIVRKNKKETNKRLLAKGDNQDKKEKNEKNGSITFFYLILYSLGRFIIEGLRVDNIYVILGLPIAQFISIILFAAGIIGLYKVLRSK